MAETPLSAINVALVCAGKYHEIDFARLELLQLLAEHPNIRVQVFADYTLAAALPHVDALISYTCDVVAEGGELEALRDWLHQGGRWLALHGTNSIIEFVSMRPLKIATPDRAADFMDLLGTQFQAHPPIAPFTVHVAKPDDPLVAGVADFTTTDEKYLCQQRGDIDTILYCEHDGTLDAFESTEWAQTVPQPVLYRHQLDAGEVVYLTLGHCRGHYDMQPLIDYYPDVERGSWDTPEYYTLLRNGIRWVAGLEPRD